MTPKKTHREVKKPQMSARYLADYMAATETTKRTVVQKCKYQAITTVVQHDEAKASIAKFIRNGGRDLEQLSEDARRIRDRMSSADFERDVWDHNADYIERFLDRYADMAFPNAEPVAAGRGDPIALNGVLIRPQIQFRLRRLTKSNKVKVGGGMFRYAKGKTLASSVADWQSAFLFGYLRDTDSDGGEPEAALCLTIDAFGGVVHSAPTDSVKRFNEMKSACMSIAERWPAIPPPKNAVL